jgi:hypothetical protein
VFFQQPNSAKPTRPPAESELKKSLKIKKKPIYKDKTTAIKSPEAKNCASGAFSRLVLQIGLAEDAAHPLPPPAREAR